MVNEKIMMVVLLGLIAVFDIPAWVIWPAREVPSPAHINFIVGAVGVAMIAGVVALARRKNEKSSRK